MRDSSSEATSPAISEMARPWKDRIEQDHAAPTTTAAAVSTIGRNRTAPASTTASLQRHALAQPQLDEVHEDDRVAHHDAGAGDEADHRGSREERAQRPCAGRMPTSENGIAAMITSGVTSDWNQPTTST